MSDAIGYNGAPVPEPLRPILTRIDGIDAHLHDACTGRAGAVEQAIATAGRYVIKRHILIPGFAATWCVGMLAGNDRLRRAGGVGVVGLMATAAASRSIKARIRRRRPDECHPRLRDGYRISARSFPSGHAASAFAAATAIASAVATPGEAALVYGCATVLASGRVMRHRHWVSDVMAGALLGTAVTLLARTLLPGLAGNDTDR
ncbi:phosphatase PAP2 family protein [Azospirillum agricola]|uniref:phosphatase PAP2 family protein n=1 Tax=Azospirillum agricola TaxID=1720247 RepID=UPI000A0F08E6|nr:phosphatase PAP2 family protein [Azospirillum agricola]SMH62204.1 undecaprenyl-diphosphatase [Azospirillum lipoferum]